MADLTRIKGNAMLTPYQYNVLLHFSLCDGGDGLMSGGGEQMIKTCRDLLDTGYLHITRDEKNGWRVYRPTTKGYAALEPRETLR